MTKKETKLIEKWKDRLFELQESTEMESEAPYRQETADFYNGRISGMDSAIWWFEEIVERGRIDDCQRESTTKGVGK